MVKVDEIPIREIPATAVPYVLPVCEIHRTLTTVTNTVKDADETTRIVQVIRYCRCEECHKQGIGDIAVFNARKFE